MAQAILAIIGALIAIAAIVFFTVTGMAFVQRGGLEGAVSGVSGLTFKRFVALRYLMISNPEPRRRFIGMWVAARLVAVVWFGLTGALAFAPSASDPAWWVAVITELVGLYATWGLLRDRPRMLAAFVAGLAACALATACARVISVWEPDWLHERWIAIPVFAVFGIGATLVFVAQMYGLLRHSKPALALCYFGVALGALGVVLQLLIARLWSLAPDQIPDLARYIILGVPFSGPILAGVAIAFGRSESKVALVLACVGLALGFAGITLQLFIAEGWIASWSDLDAWARYAIRGASIGGPIVFGIAMRFGRLRSRAALVTAYAGLWINLLGLGAQIAISHHWNVVPEEVPDWFRYAVLGISIGGPILAGVATLFGTLRAYFTFYSTVPIGGVWIGTAALVCVVAVMTGFESDLREKILGSNAHVQVSREKGDFTEWRDVKKRIDATPGVLASTPFAVSEVVIAADNNGQNVIIKGIDPASVGNVTKLVQSIEGADDAEKLDAMKRLEPMIDDRNDLIVKPKKDGAGSGSVVDPPPSDLPNGGDPIDFSKGEPDDPGSSASPGSAPGAGSSFYGGDAQSIEEDPPPPDLLELDEPPIDYSQDTGGPIDPTIHIVDDPLDTPSTKRTLSLPGILVGRELVKQTHIYRDKEVRVVSPLSDPSNPDATGTPIPFNRDYRVAGIFYSGMYEYDLKYVYVTLESLQQFLDRGDAVDGIEIRLGSPDDSDAMVERLQHDLGPQYRVQDWKELNRSLFTALKLEKIAMFLVLGIVILVASFSIVGNLIMVVVEKGREIALLKTLGASDAAIMQVFAIQGLFIGLIGTIIGVATGLAACWAGQRYNIPLNPDVYYIDKMPIVVEPMAVAVTALAGVGISIAATFYPALIAARVKPAAGLRH